jgi:actin-related protein
MYVANQAVLPSYAIGRVGGVILESGDGITNVVPMNQG